MHFLVSLPGRAKDDLHLWRFILRNLWGIWIVRVPRYMILRITPPLSELPNRWWCWPQISQWVGKGGGEEVQRTVNHLIRLSVLKLILPEYGLVGPDLAVYEDYCMSAGDDGGCGMGETYFQPLTVQIPSEGNVSDPLDDIGTVLRITEAMTFAPSGSRT
jgi:hypothetical protein